MLEFFANKITSIFDINADQSGNVKRIWHPLFLILALIALSPAISFINPLFFGISDVDKEMFRQKGFISFLIIVSNLLLFYNTLMFFTSANKVVKKFVDKESPKTLKLDKNLKLFNIFNIGTLLASFVVCFLYALKLFGCCNLTCEQIFLWNEISTVFIFGLFCIADYLMHRLIKIAITSNSIDSELHALKNFTERALVTIDIAGFCGAFVIIVLTITTRYFLQNHFTDGFAIGALVFHILFTQINYAYLKTLELKEFYAKSSG